MDMLLGVRGRKGEKSVFSWVGPLFVMESSSRDTLIVIMMVDHAWELLPTLCAPQPPEPSESCVSQLM